MTGGAVELADLQEIAAPRPGRTCRTREEAFAAGWADGANDKPLTPTEITKLVALHARYALRSSA